MCNLSVGIYTKGIEKGIEKGITKGRDEEQRVMVIRLLQKHMSVDFISQITERPESYIREIAKEQNISCN